MNLGIPTIETERLILRAPREEDFEAFAAFAASEERMKFLGGPVNRASAWRLFLAGIGHWALRDYGMWMLECRETGQPAGRVGVIRNDRWPEPELAWQMFDGFEANGFALEAAEAARLHAAREWGFDHLISLIDADNGRSIALARRLGAAEEEERVINGQACVIYRHPDPTEGNDAD